jgi:proteasome accessory factor C
MAAKKRPAKKQTATKRVAKKSGAKKQSSKPAKKSAASSKRSAKSARSARPARRGPRSAAQRVSGLLVMLPWIMQRQRVKISTMARQFNLSEAELVEDLQMAAVCGVPPYTPDALIDVYMDDGMVIAEVPLVFSRPLKLSTAELFAVSVMAQTALQLPGANKKGPLASALAKLAPLMPAGAETIKVQLPKTRFVKELLAAVETGERHEIEYFSPASLKRTTRTITPRKVFEDAGRWYVAADDHLSGEDRVFRVDRIEKLVGTQIFDQLREVRDDELPWFSESLQQVTLRVQKQARWIVESYPYVSRVDNKDGSVDLTMSITSKHWLGRLLLRAGNGVKVLKPVEHRQLASQTAQSVLTRYKKTA